MPESDDYQFSSFVLGRLEQALDLAAQRLSIEIDTVSILMAVTSDRRGTLWFMDAYSRRGMTFDADVSVEEETDDDIRSGDLRAGMPYEDLVCYGCNFVTDWLGTFAEFMGRFCQEEVKIDSDDAS